MNLKEETRAVLKEHGKTAQDVLWCGNKEFGYFSFSELLEIAPTDYDNGYGGQEIAKDLYIVGDDWWLERHEYDGSEWWEFKSLPKKPSIHKKPRTVCSGGETLKEMNQ